MPCRATVCLISRTVKHGYLAAPGASLIRNRKLLARGHAHDTPYRLHTALYKCLNGTVGEEACTQRQAIGRSMNRNTTIDASNHACLSLLLSATCLVCRLRWASGRQDTDEFHGHHITHASSCYQPASAQSQAAAINTPWTTAACCVSIVYSVDKAGGNGSSISTQANCLCC